MTIFCLRVLTCTFILWAAIHEAQAQPVDRSLNETVQMIPIGANSGSALETTIYRPDGPGPFPLVVINHAKHGAEASQQERFRPASAARYFLQRGYAVVVPMRQGFSRSGGWYAGAGCDLEQNGRSQAEDIAIVLRHLAGLPWVDSSKIVVLGQSHGGFVTLAFGAANYPGVKALINFAGGSRNTQCTLWEHGLTQAVAAFGKSTKTPSLWFYGNNDNFFGQVFHSMHAHYRQAGGDAQLITLDGLSSDAHYLFLTDEGRAVWEPQVATFLQRLGLPHAPLAENAKFGITTSPPKASHFAALEDVEKVPHLKFFGRRAYKNFLTIAPPKAFAIGPDGAYGWAYGFGAPERALDHCFKNTKQECRLYAIDNDVVWTSD
ncbi:MAG: dienelactone hydrolase family protein [Ramlibacter sp.]|nr:dienelactone hydrolase family protein [Ramlibacter sp.]